MASRSYSRETSIETFGAKLLVSGDLDPLYIALCAAKLETEQLRRWLFAYWCCYHAGASSWLSEKTGEEYWNWLFIMADNQIPTPPPLDTLGQRWPRGHERRHFRGATATRAVRSYQSRFPDVESLVKYFEIGDRTSPPTFENFSEVRQRVMSLPQFGPWIAFKVADMLERVRGLNIRFIDGDVLMFDQPYSSALIVYRESLISSGSVRNLAPDDDAVRTATMILTAHFSQHLAPPSRNRAVNIQEVETILCKWKSHLSGSYPLYLDSHELREGLAHWAPTCDTARRLFEAAPLAPDVH